MRLVRVVDSPKNKFELLKYYGLASDSGCKGTVTLSGLMLAYLNLL